MILQSNYLEFNTPRFRKLSDDQTERLHHASLEILDRTGVCLYDQEALDLLRGQEDVEALVVQALASRALGRLDGAQGRLERAVQLGGAHHPAYVEALWELAGLYLLRKKAGNAERLLDEVASLDPTWRPIELSARRRGIELLRAR